MPVTRTARGHAASSASAFESTSRRWRAVLAWSLAILYISSAVWSVMGFDKTVERFGRMFYGGEQFDTVMAVGFIAAAIALGVAVVSGPVVQLAALASAGFSCAWLLTHAYVLWYGELVPRSCSARSTEPVEGMEYPILLLLGVLGFLASTALYLLTPGKRRPEGRGC